MRIAQGIIIAIVAATAAWFSFANAMGNVFATKSPAMALSFDASNDDANDAMASALIRDHMLGKGDLASSMPYVENILLSTTGMVASVRNYAILTDAKIVKGNAPQMMDLAMRLSRHDLPTMLWQIEKASQANDIGATLAFYNKTLVSSPESRGMLFPILARGLDDETLRQPILNMIARKPNWFGDFINYLLSNEQAVRYFPAVYGGLKDKQIVSEKQQSRASKMLLTAGEFDLALQLIGDGTELSGDMSDFSNISGGLDQFGWQSANSGTLTSSPIAGGGLRVQVSRGTGGKIATRYVSVPAGGLSLEAQVKGTAGLAQERMPSFRLSCVGKNARPQSVTVSQKTGDIYYYSGRFSQSGCSIAMLTISAPGNFEGRALTYEVQQLRVGGQ